MKHPNWLRGLLAGVLVWAHGSAMNGAEPATTGTVQISRERLAELERKAAEADRLKAELEALKRGAAANPAAAPAGGASPGVAAGAAPAAPASPTVEIRYVTAKPAPVLPPGHEKALEPGQVVSVEDLVNHFAADPGAAKARYQDRVFLLRGVISDVDKAIFTSPYTVLFRVPGFDPFLECEFVPDRSFNRVFKTSDGERIIGESPTRKVTFAKVGTDVVVRGHCLGLKGRTIRFGKCQIMAAQ